MKIEHGEFWGRETITESEIKVVSLKQIITIDPTVLEVADLPVQFAAFRETKAGTWNLIAKN